MPTASETYTGAAPSTTVASEPRSGSAAALWSIEELRLAEARLVRRRQTACGPNQTTREVLRLITEAADRGQPARPRDIAREVDISAGGLTAILKRLQANGLIDVRPVPGDGRAKAVVPMDRNQPDASDPVSRHIAAIADQLDDRDAELVASVLDAVRRAVDRECR